MSPTHFLFEPHPFTYMDRDNLIGQQITVYSSVNLSHVTPSMHSPPLLSSPQTPPFSQGLLSQAPALLQHWYTPNTLLLPGPAHSAVSPTLIGSPLSSKPSRQPMKFRGWWWISGAELWVKEAKSKAPWERNIRHGSVRVEKAGWCWSRVSLREVELTSSRMLCHCPSDTGSDLISKEPGEVFPHLYLNCSSPSVSWERKMRLSWQKIIFRATKYEQKLSIPVYLQRFKINTPLTSSAEAQDYTLCNSWVYFLFFF